MGRTTVDSLARFLITDWVEKGNAPGKSVTGAASGMGLATAQAFAKAGAAVVLADFREDAVNAEAQKLVAAGHRALAVRCDVSDDSQVAAMVDHTVAAWGRLDAAFNNAGVMARIASTGQALFFSHVHLHGGPAPVRRYNGVKPREVSEIITHLAFYAG